MSAPADLPSSVARLAWVGSLFEEHRSRLLAMLQRRIDPRLNVRLDAEEVLQKSFLDARRKADGFDASGMSPYAWLYRIALDRLIEEWRGATRKKSNMLLEMPWPDESSVQLGLNLIAPGTKPSDAAAREELQARMQEALALLKDFDREILALRYFDQLSFRECAEVVGVTENAATVRCARALMKLRKVWESLNPNDRSR